MKRFILAPNIRIAKFYMAENNLNPHQITYIPPISDSVAKFRGLNEGELIWIDSPDYPATGILSELLALAAHRGLKVKRRYT